MYITFLGVHYANGISFVECSNIITNMSTFYYEGRTEKQPSTQEEIDLFKSKLKEQNLEIKNGQLVPIQSEFPKSWGEYCDNPIKKGYITYHNGEIKKTTVIDEYIAASTFPTIELAEAIDAFKKLVILRQVWIKDWKPTTEKEYWCIYFDEDIKSNFNVYRFKYARSNFSFPTKEMAEEFLETFKDLFIKAIPVL